MKPCSTALASSSATASRSTRSPVTPYSLRRDAQERSWLGIQYDPAQRGHRRAVSQAPWQERDHERVAATGAHHAACEDIPPRGACPLLCSLLRCGTHLVRHVSADRFPRAGSDVPALERRELRVANCAGDLETGTGILPEAMGRS